MDDSWARLYEHVPAYEPSKSQRFVGGDMAQGETRPSGRREIAVREYDASVSRRDEIFHRGYDLALKSLNSDFSEKTQDAEKRLQTELETVESDYRLAVTMAEESFRAALNDAASRKKMQSSAVREKYQRETASERFELEKRMREIRDTYYPHYESDR